MRQDFGEWFRLGAYFLTPEDSNDTVYRTPGFRAGQRLPRYVGHLKTLFWAALAILFTVALAQLQ